MAWEENSRIRLHTQLIAILSRIGVVYKLTFVPLYLNTDKSQCLIATVSERISQEEKVPNFLCIFYRFRNFFNDIVDIPKIFDFSCRPLSEVSIIGF